MKHASLDKILNRPYNKWSTDQKKAIRRALRARDGNNCFYCKVEFGTATVQSPLRATIEHLEPRTNGGSNQLDNLVLACDVCNNRRGDQPIFDFLHSRGVYYGTLTGAMDYARMLSMVTGRRSLVMPRGDKFLIRAGKRL